MKKVIILPILFMAIVLTMFLFSQDKLSGKIEVTEVHTGDFQWRREVAATADGRIHRLYFPGNIIEICCESGEEIRKNQTLLFYGDAYGNRKKLLSPVSGIVVQIENGMAVVKGMDLIIRCRVDLETRNRLSIGSSHMFTTQNQHYRVKLLKIPRLGVNADNRLVFDLEFSVEDDGRLLIGQSGILTLDLGTDRGVLLVDRQALLKDRKGYYLLEKGYLEDPGHPELYRQEIELVRWDDENAQIRGIGLESVEVCVFSEEIKELLDAG